MTNSIKDLLVAVMDTCGWGETGGLWLDWHKWHFSKTWNSNLNTHGVKIISQARWNGYLQVLVVFEKSGIGFKTTWAHARPVSLLLVTENRLQSAKLAKDQKVTARIMHPKGTLVHNMIGLIHTRYSLMMMNRARTNSSDDSSRKKHNETQSEGPEQHHQNQNAHKTRQSMQTKFASNQKWVCPSGPLFSSLFMHRGSRDGRSHHFICFCRHEADNNIDQTYNCNNY